MTQSRPVLPLFAALAGAAAVALSSVSPAAAKSARPAVPKIAFTQYTLPNGLRVIVVPTRASAELLAPPHCIERLREVTALGIGRLGVVGSSMSR